MKTLRFGSAIAMAFLAVACCLPGCIVIDHEGGGCRGDLCSAEPGEMRFYWAFELEDGSASDWCDVAKVARIDIAIYNDWGEVEFMALDRPCGDAGAVIDNFLPGTYTINLRGVCQTATLTHEGWWTVDVHPGINDYGVLVLDYLGPCQ